MFHIQDTMVDFKSPHLSAATKSAPSPRRIPEDEDDATFSLDFPAYIQMKKQRSNLLVSSTDATTMEVLEDEGGEMCGFTAQQLLATETIRSPSSPATEALGDLQEQYGSSPKISCGTRSCLVDSLEVEAVLCREFFKLRTAKTFQEPRPHRKEQKGLKRSLRFSQLQSLTHHLRTHTRKSFATTCG
jgi:hypothetical protein